MTTDNPTENPELDGAHVTPAGGEAAVADASTLTLAELNSFLGKDFKDTPTALKSLKDTQSFVGKRTQDIEAAVRASLTGAAPAPVAPADAPASKSDVQRLERDLFFAQNPAYAPYRNLIEKLGTNPSEVIETAEFKDVFEKGKIADDVTSKRSIVSSSPRLAQAKSVTDTAVAIANSRGSTQEDVALTLARGIRDEASQG